MRIYGVIFVLIFWLCAEGCTNKGNLQKKVYMDSSKTSKGMIEYQIPISK